MKEQEWLRMQKIKADYKPGTLKIQAKLFKIQYSNHDIGKGRKGKGRKTPKEQ